ncbi:hypothetical protein EG347_14700 [Chryseobacterium sp. G0186]|uniref:Imm12 family immunity protein n=1 Tax=Chryseobacterium sp. G0186 TaxID=2487064 RepID=UPI000F507BF6|nr:Imm12 family immunity protein [Chryseobacterium sp. G0186]AZA78668.1 hypothetical protein EG347_14700 [Chryseobacterium sp. G0186]
MELVISTAIGGQVVDDPNINIRVINIALIKEIKQRFLEIEFESLKKIKVDLYISGDVSEYCEQTGIYKNKYFKTKLEVSSEFCLSRSYWNTSGGQPVEEKLKEFIKKSLIVLGDFIKEKLEGSDFRLEQYLKVFKDW